MAQVFHRSTNTLAKVSIFGGVFALAGGLWLLLTFSRTDYVTKANTAREQPVPFSHQHHVGGIGLDCRYCHTSVETSRSAGIPPTRTCMNCHSQVWSDSPMLEPVRASYRENRPLTWLRVHDLPDFVYFDHSVHVSGGVGCTTCHGPVDRMPLTWQHASLLMEWCLECHRNPERYVRPKEEVFNVTWQPPADQIEKGRELVEAYGIATRTSCSTCHR